MKATIPAAEERVYPGWRGFGYHHPVAGFFCGIFPSRKWVALGFENGVLLPDPDGRLVAGGTSSKKVRYLRFTAPPDIRPAIVRPFLKAAVALQAQPRRRGARDKGPS